MEMEYPYHQYNPQILKGWILVFLSEHQGHDYSSSNLQSSIAKTSLAVPPVAEIDSALSDLLYEDKIILTSRSDYPGQSYYKYHEQPATPKYPSYLMEKVRQELGLNSWDTSRDGDINMMSHNAVLDACLEWEGIIGYGYTIRDWIKDIYGVTLE